MTTATVVYFILLVVLLAILGAHAWNYLTEGALSKIDMFKAFGVVMLLIVYLLLWPVVEDAHAKRFVFEVPQKVPISCVNSTETGGYVVHDGVAIRDTRELAFPIVRCADSSVTSRIFPGDSIHINEKFD